MTLKYCFFAGVLGIGSDQSAVKSFPEYNSAQSFPEVLVESSQEKMTPRVLVEKTLHRGLQQGPPRIEFLGPNFQIPESRWHQMFHKNSFGPLLQIVWVLMFFIFAAAIVTNIINSISFFAGSIFRVNGFGDYGTAEWFAPLIGLLFSVTHFGIKNIGPFGYWLIYSIFLYFLQIILYNTLSGGRWSQGYNIVYLFVQILHFFSYYETILRPTIEIFRRFTK